MARPTVQLRLNLDQVEFNHGCTTRAASTMVWYLLGTIVLIFPTLYQVASSTNGRWARKTRRATRSLRCVKLIHVSKPMFVSYNYPLSCTQGSFTPLAERARIRKCNARVRRVSEWREGNKYSSMDVGNSFANQIMVAYTAESCSNAVLQYSDWNLGEEMVDARMKEGFWADDATIKRITLEGDWTLCSLRKLHQSCGSEIFTEIFYWMAHTVLITRTVGMYESRRWTAWRVKFINRTKWWRFSMSVITARHSQFMCSNGMKDGSLWRCANVRRPCRATTAIEMYSAH